MEPEQPNQPVAFRHSIAATLASAQGILVIVLIAISLVATLQFGNVAQLVSVTSDGAEALMRIGHALDLQRDTLRAFQDGYAKEANPDARAKLAALLDDMSEHLGRATTLVATEAERDASRCAIRPVTTTSSKKSPNACRARAAARP